MNDTILEIKDLHVLFPVHKKWLPAVDGVNLKIEKGEITGVVGESGSGKSVMSQTILRLRDHDTNVRYEGEILFEGEDLLKQPLNKIRDIRGDRISVIFQVPLTSLSPVHTVGSQLSEVLTLHKGLNKEQAKEKAIEMLKLTGIPNPENCFKQYPYELSGGMQQRVMIAMAFINNPALLIADEPTTALDVTIQTQIMDLMRQMNKKTNTAILLISHDLGVVSRLCSRVYIMYAGRIVESGPVDEILTNPLHPYTKGLVEAIPDITKRGKPLKAIPGSVPGLYARNNTGCGFAERCEYCTNKCQKEVPPLVQEDGRAVACWNKNFDSGRGNTHD